MMRSVPFSHFVVSPLVLASAVGLAVVPFSPFATRAAIAAPPSTKPALSIETGMHTAPITAMDTDRSNRYFVTASLDKSARVWELSEGGTLTLLRTLRPPSGTGREGSLYAVAISPDAQTVACAGWTGVEWDNKDCIYLFDRATGQMKKRITGLPDAIFALRFSSDGKALVATFGGNGGFRAYQTGGDYKQIGADDGYGNIAQGADFDAQGRLVTTSHEGTVRLYSPQFKKIAQQKLAQAKLPAGVRFSPDGSKVAVGFLGGSKVVVLSGKDLSPLYEPKTDGLSGALASVAWAADGDTLYAAGEVRNNNDDTIIRRWDNGGQGDPSDFAGAGDAISSLVTLRAGVACAALEPSFALFTGEGRRVGGQECPVARQGGAFDAFRLSEDAQTVRFSYKPRGASPALFSASEQNLVTNPAALNSGTLTPPQTAALGGKLTNYENNPKPQIGNVTLKLAVNELSLSGAYSPDGQHVLLGTNFNLRCYKSDGTLAWSLPAPGQTRYVNVANNNNKLAVAAFSDGTIRWFRMDDGKELLALFPHADGRRWVAWTPSGYYDASIGGEDLIGWRINRSTDNAADFFSASQFKNQFRRADVVKRVLASLDESAAVVAANEAQVKANAEAAKVAAAEPVKPNAPKLPPVVVAPPPVVAVPVETKLPPVVTIVSPSDGTVVTEKQVKVKFMLRTPGNAPIKSVNAYIDGQRGLDFIKDSQSAGSASDGSEMREITIEVPRGNSRIAVLAVNSNAASTPAIVRVTYKPAETPPPPINVADKGNIKINPEAVLLPKLYILAVGVSKYAKANVVTPLVFPSKDARDFAQAMAAQKGLLYQDVVTKVLTDGEATAANVRDGLEWIEKETTTRDVAMVFISGHGDNDNTGQFHILTNDFDGSRWRNTAVSDTELRESLARINGKARVLFLDTCHSGNVDGSRRKGRPGDIKEMVNDLSTTQGGVVVFASSTGSQSSLERDEWGNGAFTKALIEGIKGKADLMHNGKITISLLDAWICDRVKTLTDGAQTPAGSKPQTVPDFPIAVVR